MKSTRRKKLPVILEPGEAGKLLSIPNRRYIIGKRNKAVLSLMLNAGLRISEVVNLTPGNINLTNRKLRIVNGKGGVDRDLIIPENIVDTLQDWKRAKPKDTKHFFVTIKNRKKGICISKRGTQLSTRNIQLMIKGYTRRARINKNVTPHTLRHSFATEHYRQKKDIETLRQILGHADISTTQIYITLGNVDVENSMNGFKTFNNS